MPAYGNEPESIRWSRDVVVAGLVLIVALFTPHLSEQAQQRVANTLQATVLSPFLATQERLTEARLGAEQVDSLLAQLDSLSAALATQAALTDENRTLRELLDLAERRGAAFQPATVLRPGTPGSESMFLVDVGSGDGVREGAPVVNARGLIGVIREVRTRNSVGMDWSHPDFRASAMIEDGSAYGLVENRPGRFREEDRLVLNGIPFNEPVTPGVRVLTSGLGDFYPRGIPIGRVDAQADAEGSWRKSYFLEPAVRPGAATHVLVLTRAEVQDLLDAWPSDSTTATPDTVQPDTSRGRPGTTAVTDSTGPGPAARREGAAPTPAGSPSGRERS